MDADAEVRSVGPLLMTRRIDGVRLGLEETDLGERQRKRPRARGVGAHWEVAPRGEGQLGFAAVSAEDFLAEHAAPAEVGAEPRQPTFGQGTAVRRVEAKGKLVADETHEALAGRGVHEELQHPAKSAGPPCLPAGAWTKGGVEAMGVIVLGGRTAGGRRALVVEALNR